jgi:hypothetical protein
MNLHNEPLYTACTRHEHLLEDYLAGALSGAQSEWVATHLTTCEGCRRAVSDARAGSYLWRLAGSLATAPSEPHAAFARTVMARIRDYQMSREGAGLWNPFVTLAWKFAATAALALLIMVTYAVSRADQNQIEGISVAQAALPDIFSPVPSRNPNIRDEAILMMVESNYANR